LSSYSCPSHWPGRDSFCCCRVYYRQTPTGGAHSFARAGTAFTSIGSIRRGLCAFLIRPAHLVRSIVVLKPSTLLHFHQALKNRKCRLLFSPTGRRKPGPKGPSQELIDAVIQMKWRNPTWGCPRIAQQIALAFGVELDKDVARRILAVHFRPVRESGGPSWLTFLGHMKDSLWSVDLFRVQVRDTESALGLVVMDSTRA
jgi:hypothetical protein